MLFVVINGVFAFLFLNLPFVPSFFDIGLFIFGAILLFVGINIKNAYEK